MDILLVEDNPQVARVIERALGEAGHNVEVVGDGAEALLRGEGTEHDVIVLDLLLPKMDGLEVCRHLRRDRVRTPILMLTARNTVSDRVCGLDAGADDYLTKPFALEELLARVRALVRRSHDEDEALRVGDLTLDVARHEVRREDHLIELTAKEFELLHYLMLNPGRVLTKAQLFDHVWGLEADLTSNVVEIYIHYLRNRIDRGYARPLIRTVRGIGYTVKP